MNKSRWERPENHSLRNMFLPLLKEVLGRINGLKEVRRKDEAEKEYDSRGNDLTKRATGGTKNRQERKSSGSTYDKEPEDIM